MALLEYDDTEENRKKEEAARAEYEARRYLDFLQSYKSRMNDNTLAHEEELPKPVSSIPCQKEPEAEVKISEPIKNSPTQSEVELKDKEEPTDKMRGTLDWISTAGALADIIPGFGAAANIVIQTIVGGGKAGIALSEGNQAQAVKDLSEAAILIAAGFLPGGAVAAKANTMARIASGAKNVAVTTGGTLIVDASVDRIMPSNVPIANAGKILKHSSAT